MRYDILPNLTFTAGGRVFYAANSLKGFFGFSDGYSSHTGVSQCFAPTSVAHAARAPNLDKIVYESGFTHKLNLSWKIDDDHLVYATWSTGFRPGGVNRRGTIPPYKPDRLTNYEIGWKTILVRQHAALQRRDLSRGLEQFPVLVPRPQLLHRNPQRRRRAHLGRGERCRLATDRRTDASAVPRPTPMPI